MNLHTFLKSEGASRDLEKIAVGTSNVSPSLERSSGSDEHAKELLYEPDKSGALSQIWIHRISTEVARFLRRRSVNRQHIR